MNVVRPAIASSSASLISRSVEESTEEVASSRISTRGSASSARAIARRWRWPPERLRPRSPTRVWKPWGRRVDELVRLRALRGQFDLGEGGVRARVGDVLGDGGGEQEGIVADDRDRVAQRAQVDLADVGAVDEHGARARVVQARDERDEAGLARAGGPDERDRAPGGHVEVDVAQHRPRGGGAAAARGVVGEAPGIGGDPVRAGGRRGLSRGNGSRPRRTRRGPRSAG